MTFLRIGALCATALASVALAGNPERQKGFNEADHCRIDADPFAVPAFVPRHGALPGPLDANKCVLQHQYRPVLPLTDAEIATYGFQKEAGRRYVANVRGFDGWYTASIPVQAASALHFMVNIRKMPVLGVRGGHSEMRIHFDEPVVLVPQWPLNPEGRIETRELVFTANPAPSSPGAQVDPVRNFDGSLLQARGIHTREARVRFSFIESHTYTIHQYRLRMNAQEAAAYMNAWIDRSAKKRLTQRFILSGINCDSTQFEVLDHVLRHRYRLFQHPFDPHFAKQRLLERKLIESEAQPFESEDWVQDIFSEYGRHAPE